MIQSIEMASLWRHTRYLQVQEDSRQVISSAVPTINVGHHVPAAKLQIKLRSDETGIGSNFIVFVEGFCLFNFVRKMVLDKKYRHIYYIGYVIF